MPRLNRRLWANLLLASAFITNAEIITGRVLGERDKCGRKVGKVLVNGQDVSQVQLQRGFAWQLQGL